MTRRKVEETKPDPIPSPALQDPALRLAAAVLVRAFEELRGPDLVGFIDALAWLLCGDAPLFFEALGYPKDYDDLLNWIIGGNHDRPAITVNRAGHRIGRAYPRRAPGMAGDPGGNLASV